MITIGGHYIKNFYFVSNYLAKGLGAHKTAPNVFINVRWNRTSSKLYFKSNVDESWDIKLGSDNGIHPEQRLNEKFLVNQNIGDKPLELGLDEYITYRIGEVAYNIAYDDVLCKKYPLFGVKNK